MKIIAILGLLFGVWGCHSQPPFKTGLEGTPLPSFDLMLADSISYFNTSAIPQGKVIILFSFETTCPYSRAQTSEIIKNLESLKNINFYMSCNNRYSEFKRFYDQYKLGEYPNILAGVDTALFFMRYFNAPQVPYIAVYTSDKKLKQVMVGKIKISTIKSVALE
jgi:hypothetical protein